MRPHHSIAKLIARLPMADHLLLHLQQDPVRSADARASVFGRMISLISRYGTFDPITRSVRYRGTNENFRLKLDLSRQLECRYYFGPMNGPLDDLIRSFSSGAFLDIGANFGYYSCLAAEHFDKVHAFEPTPGTYQRLQQNIDYNNFSNVTCHPIALSDHSGTAEFFLNPYDAGLNRLGPFSNASPAKNKDGHYQPGDENIESIEVEVQPLDEIDFGDLENLELIKIDVEGFEAGVVRGARSLIERHQPIIFAEIWDEQVYQEVMDCLPTEYKSWDPVKRTQTTISCQPDTIFAPDDPWS